MKFSTTIYLGFISLLTPTLAIPTPSISMPLGSEGSMHVKGPVVPGGPNMDFDGTVEEVIEKMGEMNPEWERQQGPGKALESRYWRGAPKCVNIGGKGALAHRIDEGVRHLEGLGSRICSAPASDCSRVSCSYGSAIFLCSNRDRPADVPCERIGAAAKRIREDCTDPAFTFFGNYVDGHWIDTDGYAVYVRDGNC
ncbi:hypothetical protein TWF481_006197 [Arthrobotrys musiformis]|uniref:Uncharacterized protein n=1 Tax=Arthrobotrys musiformis TaxID=47236 RepID=A0AAV9WI04_9PEZI